MYVNISHFPPATHALRPERKERQAVGIETAVHRITGYLLSPIRTRMNRMQSIVPLVEQFGSAFENSTDEQLREAASNLRIQLRRKGFRDELVARSFALVREVARRFLGMRHFDCQLVGGMVLLKGMVAEMETGEGKTLTATLAAGTAALAGVPVHVITVNDYLTARDANWMGPVYKALGLTVGCITHGLSPEARRTAYQSEVTYCTNKEIAFDYLRDKMRLEDCENPLRLQAELLQGGEARARRLLLRGLHYAIVDEADSVLIDEARTPLLISRMTDSGSERRFLTQALQLADSLLQRTDYHINRSLRKVELTEAGKRRIPELSVPFGPLWTGATRRQEMVTKALQARHLFKRDEHYLVRDGKVEIVDEFTGRVMPDRAWERGLHQLIEVKEGCELSGQRDTLARISYQRFFRRYLHLAGMTGTAREVKAEMWSVYGLPVVTVPTNRPTIRARYADQMFPSLEAKWQAVVERVQQLYRKGRPVLVGTRSVAASEHVSRLLTEIGLDHQVLNAKQDGEEARIIANAGNTGCITIATNMAGRGTDIKLGPGVAKQQGLHVILTERHEAGRIDRQLAGRCGRQGDPGSYEAILSLEDPLCKGARTGLAGWVSRRLLRPGSTVWTWVAKLGILRAQKKMERYHARIRRDLLKQDKQIGMMLSFSGRLE